MKTKRLALPQYRANLLIVHGTQDGLKRAEKTCKIAQVRSILGLALDDSNAPAGMCPVGMAVSQGRLFLIFVDEKQSVRDKRLTGVHEAVHAASAILAMIGHKHSGLEDENLAHLAEYLTNEVWKVCGV